MMNVSLSVAVYVSTAAAQVLPNIRTQLTFHIRDCEEGKYLSSGN